MKTTLKNHMLSVITMGTILFFTFSACKKNDEESIVLNRDVTVYLSGIQEVPSNTSTGTGTGQVLFDPIAKTITYSLTWTLGSSTATTTNMHFHGAEDGADTKSSGVVIGITGFTTANTGTVSGVTRALTDTEVNQLLGGKWYMNVHSSTIPGGEIRGNIKF